MRAFSLVSSFAVLALAGATGVASARPMTTVSHGRLYAVCHRAGPHSFITLHVDDAALAYHVGHGDYAIACPKGGGDGSDTPS